MQATRGLISKATRVSAHLSMSRRMVSSIPLRSLSVMATSRYSLNRAAASTVNRQQLRTYVSPSFVQFVADADVEKGVQNITDLFMIARDELEYAEEARGSVYYNDDKETARQAVQETLDAFDVLLKDLDDAQKLDVQRKIGLKILELKSQLDALNAEELE
ncbi:hypothetical protein FBU30_010211 [Linnemannia zychae]|nr:hypothetical protein FBU30_010211 [Linnemannia zychae]